MHSYWLGLIFVLFTTILSVAGMLLVRKKVGVASLVAYHEVAGYLLSVIGTLYAVLLGFVVVDAMQHVQDLRVLTEKEASGVANIYLLVQGFHEPERTKIRGLCTDYARAVVDKEWDDMQRGTYSPEAFAAAWALWKEITVYTPKSDTEQNVHQQIVSEICGMTESHRTRLVAARHGVAPVLWVVLIVGGIFTVMFTYFFGVESVKAQIIMTAVVSLTLALNVFLVYIFGNPFSGDLSVHPDAFKLDLLIFKNFEAGKIEPNLNVE